MKNCGSIAKLQNRGCTKESRTLTEIPANQINWKGNNLFPKFERGKSFYLKWKMID